MFFVGQNVKCKESKDTGKIIEITEDKIYVLFTCGLVKFVEIFRDFQLSIA